MSAHLGYDPILVGLSIIIAILASYTALDLGGRVRGTAPGRRWAWVVGAAIAMGGGIWSMHFVGMLAFQVAMPVAYESGLTILSLLIAIGVTGAAFAWVGRRGARTHDVLVSGPVMGLGVAAMHYTGMAAMRMHANLAYSLPIVVVSVLIAVVSATTALWLTFRQNDVIQKLIAAVVMGVAVAGMHYTGMAAATFTETTETGMAAHSHPMLIELGQQNLALYVSGATFLILFLALLASSIEQQRTRRDLGASEARFRAAVEAVGDIVWTNDAKGEMRGPQPEWQNYTGQSQDEVQGFGWSAAIHPDDVPPTLASWNAAVADRRKATFEHRVRRHDGVYRYFSVRAVPVLHPDGTIREWVGVHEDITERQEFETALRLARDAAEEANVAKSTFLANMSHELRTPLSAIIGYSEMLQEEIEDGSDPSDLKADVSRIEGNARHLLGLINDVLDLSKIESGRMEVFAEDFDLASVLHDVAGTSEALVEKKGNRLELDLAPGLGSIHSDLTKIRQIMLNLLSNASKFTEKGVITVRAKRQGNRAILQVADTGIGMTDEQISKLFQRFQQADASTTRKFGGTGLGLSLTRAFATMLGGEVMVESVPGRGSTFTVTLPLTYAPPERESDPTEEQEREGGGDLVLVIDDDADQRSLMTRFLHREGFRARTAADGETGLALARELQPRAILLDVMMPGVDGWSVLTALKADPNLSQIPVVMVTFVDQRALAASLGAADYVVKPVRWDRFKAVMDRYRPPEDNILVVEDDDNIRRQIRTVLERDGWHVTEAENGRVALDRFAEARPGVVLLDLMMPVMDGFECLQNIRARPEGASVPIVILTSLDLTREDRRRLQGANQVLNKGDTNLRSLTERLHGFVRERSAVVEPQGAETTPG